VVLAPGTRLGPSEVAAQIGVGGMGEVYRATDTNLRRQVAIKILPESVAGDGERLARFQREAEVLAFLNHPNIAAIYWWVEFAKRPNCSSGCPHDSGPFTSAFAPRWPRARAEQGTREDRR
jgi:serine/threonine protein kinase